MFQKEQFLDFLPRLHLSWQQEGLIEMADNLLIIVLNISHSILWSKTCTHAQRLCSVLTLS